MRTRWRRLAKSSGLGGNAPCNSNGILRKNIASAITHGLAVLLAIAGGTSLIVLSANHAGAREVISAAVFTATRVVMYVASSLYHAISQPRTKQRLKVFDHCAIFLLIAGTYASARDCRRRRADGGRVANPPKRTRVSRKI
ncbi:MAG: hemolysin III family protein [Candidatus Macondimonas sp.]